MNFLREIIRNCFTTFFSFSLFTNLFFFFDYCCYILEQQVLGENVLPKYDTKVVMKKQFINKMSLLLGGGG
jgi:hypothetical protein